MRILVTYLELSWRSKSATALAAIPWRRIGAGASFYSNTRVACSGTSSPVTPRSVSTVNSMPWDENRKELS